MREPKARAIAWAATRRHALGPDWRWQLARPLALRPPPRRPTSEDQAVQDAAAYLRRARGPAGKEAAAAAFPLIAAAEALNNDTAASDRLKILTLGGCTRAEIAARLPAPEETIRAWHDLFLGWSPACLDQAPAAGLAPVLARLRLIDQHLGISMRAVSVWRPAAADLERIRFCLEHGTPADVQEALLGSVENSSEPVVLPRAQVEPPRRPTSPPLSSGCTKPCALGGAGTAARRPGRRTTRRCCAAWSRR